MPQHEQTTPAPGAVNSNDQLIETLRRSATFQNYERAFAVTTGMPLALRSVENWQLPFRGLRRESAFCAVMAEKSRTCAACLQLQEKLSVEARDEPATRTCAYGLCETAVPVKLGPQTIGFLQTGQVMRQPPNETSFQRAVAQAANRGVEIQNEPTRRAYFATPVVGPKKLEAIAGLLAIFAEHLAIKSNQLVVQTVHAESPLITRAKRFIQEHYTEELSLDQVSSTVHTNRFYFCRQFRKATGVSFTEFVSRTRVEKAQHLLLNPNLQISEIAFAAGFQSLANFNRMFKKIVGRSPTNDRDQLPSAAGFPVSGYSRPAAFPEPRLRNAPYAPS